MVLKLDNMTTEVKWNFHRAHWKGFTADLEDLSAKEQQTFFGKYDMLLSLEMWHYLRSEEVSEAIEEDIWNCIMDRPLRSI